MAKKPIKKKKVLKKKSKTTKKKRKSSKKPRETSLDTYLRVSQELFSEGYYSSYQDLKLPIDAISKELDLKMAELGKKMYQEAYYSSDIVEEKTPSLMEVQEKIYELEKSLPWHKRIWLKLKGWV